MNTEQQRAEFEAWYGPDQTSYPPEVVNNQWPQDKLKAWEAWQAALKSPQVQDLKDALQSILYDMEAEGRGTGYEYQNARAVLAEMEKQK